MPPESPRIAELRRRVEADPSSIAFAQLAEEYRRAGHFEASEKVCRTGLTRHPGYLSARVTLGRTLVELGKLDEAEHELEFVLKSAADNLAAIRGMAEIHQRRGKLELALDYYRRALALARNDPELEETVRQLDRDLSRAAAAAAGGAPSPANAGSADQGSSGAPATPVAAASAAGVDHPATGVPGASVAPLDEDAPIDFDALLRSIGAPGHQPPPIVQALLSEPAPESAPTPNEAASDMFAEIERGLRALESRPGGSTAGDGDVDAPAPPTSEPRTAPEPEPRVEAMDEPSRRTDDRAIVLRDETAPDYHEPAVVYDEVPAATEPFELQGGTLRPRDETAPVYAEISPESLERAPAYGESAAAPPLAPQAPPPPPAPPGPPAADAIVLAELEAWLAALKR